ncbi:BspA family leucine-rich repeat surface protein [Mycoplasma cottewii]|uniref:BspA family leucine-rich repeat surface protein n=1 Tax=Mycoplasma cottewii TaxID=51364 RepID=A0ABY5TXI1_9MOLU|nr:BspA family leucine-rich repeat surface protein [Mycoplasma cottewii]UWD35388.1 BspA family leucine-rich repeat surface protein [Mycoplasma cottewii]
MKKLICLITSFLSISASTSAWLLSKSNHSNTTINNNQTQTAQTLINGLTQQINYIKQKVAQLEQKTRLLKGEITQEKQKTMQLEEMKSELSSKLKSFERFEKKVNVLIATLDLPEDLAKKEDFTQKVLAILEFYKNTIKNIDDENNPNSFKKLFDKLIELEEKIINRHISFEQIKEERSNLEEANIKLNDQISETRKNIDDINKSITDSINRKRELESKKRKLESEIDINRDKVIKLETKVSKISEFIYKIANNIWEEKFKDNLLESESFIQIGKEFENELNKMLEKKVTLNVVNKQTSPVVNTKDTNNTAPPQKLKFTISDVLFEFDLGIVWPNRNKSAVYEDNSKSNCVEIGYTKHKDGKWQIEQFDRNTQKVPSKLPRFITSLRDAFKQNVSSEIEGIQHWNTRNVTSMWATFAQTPNFNQDISNWDMSNVKKTQSMFWEAKKFNQDINNWNMSNVTDVIFMFNGATEFNGNISNWNMSKVIEIEDMFKQATNFNKDLSAWILNNVKKPHLNGLLDDTKIKNDQSKWPRIMRDSHQQSDSNVFVGRRIIENILKVVWKNNFTNRQIPALRKYADVLPDYSKKINDFLQDTPFKGIDVELSKQQENERFPLLNNQPENRDKTFSVTVIFNNNWIGDSFNLPIGDIDETRSIAEYNDEKTECIVIGFSEDLGHIRANHMPPTVRKVPKLLPPQITSLENTFHKSEQQSIENIDQWNTRNIIHMSDLFNEATKFNQNINNWNTENVISFNRAFYRASSFNQPLSNWKVQKSLSFSAMFRETRDFNQPLNSWRFNTKELFRMDQMFWAAKSFNQDLDQWNVENLENTEFMFADTFSFNAKVSTWKTNNLSKLDYMFHGAGNFNRRVYDWDVSNVTTFTHVFFQCGQFLQPLDSWDTSIRLVNESTESFKSRVKGMLDGTKLVQGGVYPWYPKGMVQHRVYPRSELYDNGFYPGHPED